MLHVSRLFAVVFALMGAAFAQCAKCDVTGCLTCEFHAALRKPMEEFGMFLGWGEKVPCCRLAAVVPCKTCVTGDDLRKWVPARQRAHQEQLEKVWYDSTDKNKTTISTRCIADVIKHLGGDVITASTSHFFVVTNAPPTTLNRSAHKRLQPELTKAAETLPGLLEPQKALIQREHWMLLYLLRSEQLYRDYWTMLGVEPPKFIEKAPRLEAFMLHGQAARDAYVAFHDGSNRIYGRFERFLCHVTDSDDFPGEELPSDRLGHTLLAHRVAAGLTDRLVRLGAAKAPHRTPWFLELGLGHVLEARTSGKVVFQGSRPESSGRSSSSWEAADWPQRMYRLVGKPKQGSASPAPTFAQLAAVDDGSATPDHHLAAWSLMSFLLLQPGEGRKLVFEYMQAVRRGATPAEALKEVYDLDGPKLTAAWHAWVRDNPKQLLPPAKPIVSSPGEEMLANFETVMATKKSTRVSDDDHVRTRLAAIGNLRWAQPPERAATHLLALLSSGVDAEAHKARDTLQTPEMCNALVASLVWPALEEAIEKPAELRHCIHLVRAAAAQVQSRKLFLPVLHKVLATPSNPMELITAAATTLGELGDPSSQPVLEEATRSSNALVRAEAATALARLSEPSALSRARELINDFSWHVRIASIDIFRRVGTAECVPILFTRLPLENGRLAEDISNTLLAITKLKAPFETGEQWRKWWETGGKEAMAAARPAVATPATVSADAGGSTFPPILSKRFLFLIDVSKSMSQSVFLKAKAGTTSTNSDGLIETTKLRFVTEKLIRLIGDSKEIPDDVIFDIAFFAATTTNWKRQLVPTTAENRASAAQFLATESRSQESVTDLHRALRTALEGADEHLAKGKPEAALDTIYLVTDGTPTAGQFQIPDLLRSWFREANRNHRIKVYVITVGALDTDLRFLGQLAADNYGPPPVVVRRE